jgi:hypothetical protein
VSAKVRKDSAPTGNPAGALRFGVTDAWLVRTDAAGTETWAGFLGQTSFDFASAAIPTADGGWVTRTDAGGSERWTARFPAPPRPSSPPRAAPLPRAGALFSCRAGDRGGRRTVRPVHCGDMNRCIDCARPGRFSPAP